MRAGSFRFTGIGLLAALVSVWGVASQAHVAPPAALQDELLGSKIIDGRYVLKVGGLQMNVTNFGLLGSMPGEDLEMSFSPSAQWPAGSGVEFLHVAALWVGARVNGLPKVSTAYPDPEFYPGDQTTDTMYSSFEGAVGGNRVQTAFPDDDGDGAIDEDPLDGLDNDGDGRVDEDFGAIGNQMLRCRYRDDYPRILVDAPDHYPLGVEVTQEAYQWEQPELSDAVALEYTVKNVGQSPLSGVYVGLYVDPDVAHRSNPRGYNDDRIRLRRSLVCLRQRPYSRAFYLEMVEAWDGDGDAENAHPAPGRLGLMLLDTTTDVLGEVAPWYEGYVTLHSYNEFSRTAPFSEGGEAVVDEQRYELMSGYGTDSNDGGDRDWRYLVSTGPFQLAPGDSVYVRFAFLAAEDSPALLDLATRLALAQDGSWHDLDGDLQTGRDCNETLIFDPTRTIEWYDPCSMDPDPIVIPKGNPLWVNADCAWEGATNGFCDNILTWCTGVNGRETRVPWMQATAPPPPNLRVWPTESGNVLFWDSFSEQVPDGITGKYDFEGYRIWRADNWTRPPGSSAFTGPPENLWMLLDEADQINGLDPDRGLDRLRYQPAVDPNLVGWYTAALMDLPWVEDARDYLPPAGYSLADADTAIALARAELGLPHGRHYYRYKDTDVRAGLPYFYSISATDHVTVTDATGHVVGLARGREGSPSNGFQLAVPSSRSQPAWDYDPGAVYVVPNPATRETMAPWTLQPNNDDPSGLKVEFRHLPAAACTIRIWTLSGDLVQVLRHDATGAIAQGDYESTGSQAWDLVSRNGQQVASGVYLFTVDAPGFPRKRGKFTLIR